MNEVFIKPALDGAVVPDPLTHAHLAATGEWKPHSTYWICRIRDGDVVVCEPPQENPHPEEARSAVSKDGPQAPDASPVLRDAAQARGSSG